MAASISTDPSAVKPIFGLVLTRANGCSAAKRQRHASGCKAWRCRCPHGDSILELAKGKLTTDPTNHTGEGIFFSSKLFDAYDIRSGNLHFIHDGGTQDLLFEHPKDAPGTLVFMKLANDSTLKTNEVFFKFAAPDEFTFNKTVVPVRLAQYEGEKLVSRSQAKRLTARFEKFRTVILDFAGVETIGQGFADELFRVFAAAHPAIDLVPMHMTTAVQDMATRVIAGVAHVPTAHRRTMPQPARSEIVKL
jgi:hypothetical protein